jgi:hypothetical protein
MVVVTQLYFQNFAVMNYRFRPFPGWAIIRLRLEYRRNLIYCNVDIKNGGTRSRFTLFGEGFTLGFSSWQHRRRSTPYRLTTHRRWSTPYRLTTHRRYPLPTDWHHTDGIHSLPTDNTQTVSTRYRLTTHRREPRAPDGRPSVCCQSVGSGSRLFCVSR